MRIHLALIADVMHDALHKSVVTAINPSHLANIRSRSLHFLDSCVINPDDESAHGLTTDDKAALEKIARMIAEDVAICRALDYLFTMAHRLGGGASYDYDDEDVHTTLHSIVRDGRKVACANPVATDE